ncbi:hypothetical protein [Pendulispora albinea]|uniref:Bacterial surface antigen (D15) domain-containing protein n=1 Tax=Pendulispora albinea TaxID=2741071 RepID=A0ABZ2MB99_9BACT
MVPGLVVHGSGHYVRGETATGHRLLAMEGGGAAGLALGLAGLAITGASRRFVGALALLTLSGGGLFVVSTLADLYGVAAPEAIRGTPLRMAPVIRTELGLRYVYDPNFDYRSFMVQGIDYRVRGLKLAPSAWFALNDDNARLMANVGYRFVGPRPDRSARDGSYFDIDAGFLHHRYGTEQFSMTGAELSIKGRLDMVILGRTLRGSFAELGGGFGLQSYRYLGLSEEANTLLLGWFAWGFYVGPGNEILLYYDHRHDDFAGGMKLGGLGALGSGVPGHVGARGTYFVTPDWGVLADAQIGSAFVGGVSFLFRHGAKP